MRKKTMLVPFTIAAAVLLLASAAYACTVWAGKFTVWGDVAGPVSATGQPTGCNSAGNPTGGMNQVVDGGSAKTASPVGEVRVMAEPAGTLPAGCVNKLPAGVYDINWYGGRGYSNHTTWSRHCMSPLMGLRERVGEVRVDSDGYSLKADGSRGDSRFPLVSPFRNIPPEEGAVCISDPLGGYGNQAPMAVV